EFAWLQYPSTTVSSINVVVELIIALASVWFGSAHQPEVKVEDEEPKEHSE
ncbi:hypothetical protein MMC21_008497, partial [Puttea exsequens]|nr:hypothetical protein [Puttea exsequens]